MKIGLLQLDPTVGAFAANAAAIAAGVARAVDLGADLVIASELALPGYPPLDLLERPSFLDALAAEEDALVRALPAGPTVVFGTVSAEGERLYNSALVARRGEILLRAHKTLLPVYDVFDEARYFTPCPDPRANHLELAGLRIGLTVCEDLWNDKEFWREPRYGVDPVEALAGVDLLVNISASPWSHGKHGLRRELLAHTARRRGLHLAYVNQVGGNDGLIFDGRSMAFDPSGALVAEAAAFAEDLVVYTLGAPAIEAAESDAVADIHDALVLGLRDYFAKHGFGRAVVALSGGIDSAVTAALAVDALGPAAVSGLALPSRYSSAHSVADARRLAENLGIAFHEIAIEPIFAAYLAQLAPVFADAPADLTEENLQARIRGALVMAYSNKHGAVVLTTGNKSESAVGYCTLYGDTCGGLAPLADLYKHQVYALARHANRAREVVPASSIEKPPSAELRPDQKDSDSLPPYEVLDELLRLFIEERASLPQIAAALNQPLALVEEIARKVYAAEFKRKQLPPTLRVSSKAWVGRVYPLAQKFRA